MNVFLYVYLYANILNVICVLKIFNRFSAATVKALQNQDMI